MTDGKRNLIQGLLQEYAIEKPKDIQDALKYLFSNTVQEMLETEMDAHLGYSKYKRSEEDNNRNGTKTKRIRSNMVSLSWMSLRTAKVFLNRRYSQNVRRISLPLMTRSFPCMQKA